MEDLIAFLGGVIFGFFSGFIPGLHANTIISIVSSLGIDDRALALVIISLYPVHLVTSFIPSIFFGIPEPSSVVAVLPGQRMVLQGDGIQALKTVLLSCIIATLLSAMVFYLSLDIFPAVYDAVRAQMKFILLGVSVLLISKNRNPALSFCILFLAGLLGYFSLNSGMYDPFLPLFSGMFAVSAILNYRKNEIPDQEEKDVGFSFLKYSFLGVFLGFLADLVPGVGSPAQVAAFASMFIPFNTLGYLAAVSSISVSEAVFSIATSASIGKSRIGATAWLAQTISIEQNLVLLLSVFVLSMSVAVGILFLVRKHISKLASLDFSRMNIILGLYLLSITFVLDGFTGIIVLFLGGILGWMTIRLGVERINLMGAVIVPTLLLLFRISL